MSADDLLPPDSPHRRAGDGSVWARAETFWHRYSWLAGLLLLVAAAAGFGWRTPAQSFSHLERQLDSTRATGERRDALLELRVERLEAQNLVNENNWRILWRIECRRDRDGAEFAGAPCMNRATSSAAQVP